MLSKRLKKINGMILPFKGVADIGTDHALFPCEIARHPFWAEQRIIGTDFHQKPLEKAIENIRLENLQKKVDIRKGWGLEPISSGEVEQVVLAGLGGKKIAEILQLSKNKAESFPHLFLQPQRDLIFLRKWVLEKNWRIVDEELVWENKTFYVLLRIDTYPGPRWSDWELEIGPVLLAKKHPLLRNYLEEKMKEFENVLEKIKKGKQGHPAEKRWQRKIDFYKGVCQWLSHGKN